MLVICDLYDTLSWSYIHITDARVDSLCSHLRMPGSTNEVPYYSSSYSQSAPLPQEESKPSFVLSNAPHQREATVTSVEASPSHFSTLTPAFSGEKATEPEISMQSDALSTTTDAHAVIAGDETTHSAPAPLPSGPESVQTSDAVSQQEELPQANDANVEVDASTTELAADGAPVSSVVDEAVISSPLSRTSIVMETPEAAMDTSANVDNQLISVDDSDTANTAMDDVQDATATSSIPAAESVHLPVDTAQQQPKEELLAISADAEAIMASDAHEANGQVHAMPVEDNSVNMSALADDVAAEALMEQAMMAEDGVRTAQWEVDEMSAPNMVLSVEDVSTSLPMEPSPRDAIVTEDNMDTSPQVAQSDAAVAPSTSLPETSMGITPPRPTTPPSASNPLQQEEEEPVVMEKTLGNETVELAPEDTTLQTAPSDSDVAQATVTNASSDHPVTSSEEPNATISESPTITTQSDVDNGRARVDPVEEVTSIRSPPSEEISSPLSNGVCGEFSTHVTPSDSENATTKSNASPIAQGPGALAALLSYGDDEQNEG